MEPITGHRKLITLQRDQIINTDIKSQQQQQCLFSIMSCSSKSKQLKQTIQNQKVNNERQFQLSSSKNFTISSQMSKDLKTKLTKNNNQSHNKQYNESRKGICLTAKKSQNSHQHQHHDNIGYAINLQPNHTLQDSINYSTNLNNSKVHQSQSKAFHKLNPLSIDRSNYDCEVKLGGNRLNSKTRYSLHSVSKLQGSKCINDKGRTELKFNYHEPSLLSHANQQHYDLSSLPFPTYNSSSHSKVYTSRMNLSFGTSYKTSRQTQQGSFNHHQKILARKDKYDLSPFNKNYLSQQQDEKFKKIYSTYDRMSVQTQHQNFNFSHHSDKYKLYMDEKLLSSESSKEKLEKGETNQQKQQVKHIKLVSEHNQKSQNNRNPQLQQYHQRDSIHQPINKNILQNSVHSSFAVVESKQKELQKERAEGIYNLSHFVREEIESYNTSKQLSKDNNAFQQIEEGQCDEPELTEILCNSDKLRREICSLYDELLGLETQQADLRSEHQLLTCQNLHDLDEKIEQLQCLKLLSIQRGEDLEMLKEFLQTKKILKSFDSNKQRYDTYLKDENSWQQYINFKGNFDKEDSSHQTSETHSQEIFMIENHPNEELI